MKRTRSILNVCISSALLLGLAGPADARTIGPDAFGYKATDGIPFAFEDISATGTLTLAATDDGVFTAPLGFDFSFYGMTYSSVSWNTNGLLTFGGTSTQFSNGNIATTRVIGDKPSVAVLWDDWQFLAGTSEGAYYETRGAPGSRRFIVQWSKAIGFDATSETVTYQVILSEGSSSLLFQYLDVVSGDAASLGARATVGIRDTAGQVNGENLQWSFNQAVLANGMAIRFSSADDTSPPVVTVTSPADGSIVGTTSVMVSASISDDSAASVSSSPEGVSGLLPPGGGVLSGDLPLVEGENTITVSATDDFGNSGGTSITLIRDTEAPVVIGISPQDGAILGESPVTFTIDAADATATSVSFGGTSQSLPAGGGSMTAVVSLSEGGNPLALVLTDAAGNTTSLVVGVTLDLSAPVVTIDVPSGGAMFGPGESPAAVMVTVNDVTATAVSSSPDGVSGGVPAGGGVLTGSVALAEGSNEIMVTATDALGRTGSSSVTVVLDTTPPSVSIDSPSGGESLRGAVDFGATASDAAPGSGLALVELSVDGAVIASMTSAPFEAHLDTTVLGGGLHVLRAEAFDRMGNSASDEVQAFVDNTAPALSILSPADGAVVSGMVSFTVEASDPGGSGLAFLQVLANGVEPAAAPAVSYEPPVASGVLNGEEDTRLLPDGELRFSATAVDDAGNESAVSVSVRVRNSVPPTLVLKPAGGSIVSGVVPITAEASGAGIESIELFAEDVPLGRSSVSPLEVLFDTTKRLDGRLVIRGAVLDAGGSSTSASVEVTIDNLAVRADPCVLNLKSKGKRFVVEVEGPSARLLLPVERHGVELHVPGANAVPAERARYRMSCGKLHLRFDRARLLASIRAGIAAGEIDPASSVGLVLVADGLEIGTAWIKIKSRARE